MKNNKSQRITIRLTQSELESLEAKISEAGYKTTGAFVRDYIVAAKPKAKVSGNVVLISKELMSLSMLINSSASRAEVIRKIIEIQSLNTGGAL